jgi:23S rRNA pseudouridine1911/1915/1917 synthase
VTPDPKDNPATESSDPNGPDIVETQLPTEEDGLDHIRMEIRRARTNRRLDKYLSGRLGKDTSRNALQRYIREGNVTVNGKIVKPSYTIRLGDKIDMMLPPVKKQEIPAEDIPLEVIYEDDDLIAINKQSNLIVHPARGNWTGTLVNALAWYFKMNWRGPKIADLPNNGQVFRPGIVHRLDRDTTGVMLVAKSELALGRLGWQFEHRKIQKTYTAICHGLFKLDEDIIDQPIGKHPKIREKYAVHRKTGKPYPSTTKEAVTRYKVLQRIKNVGQSNASFTLVEMYPKTGRTHQLRIHTSAMNHPVVGDKMYGGGPLYLSQLEGRNDVAEGPLVTRQALHAHTIEFAHPRTNEPMKIEAPWPKDFTEALDVLQKMSH